MSQMSSMRRVIAGAGALVVFFTWLYVVLARPVEWNQLTSSSVGILAFSGYGLGTALLIAASLPVLPARTLGLIPIAVIINSLVGQIVGAVGLPLYLDSIGTVLVAALAGPVPGMATGALSNIVWGLISPASLPFAAVAALIGWLAGVLVRSFGAFDSTVRTVISGLVLGIVGAVASAPVAAAVYGGTAGVGTGAVVSLFREMGGSLVQSVTAQSIISDPLDKVVVLLIVSAVLRSLPQRTRRSFLPLEKSQP